MASIEVGPIGIYATLGTEFVALNSDQRVVIPSFRHHVGLISFGMVRPRHAPLPDNFAVVIIYQGPFTRRASATLRVSEELFFSSVEGRVKRMPTVSQWVLLRLGESLQ